MEENTVIQNTENNTTQQGAGVQEINYDIPDKINRRFELKGRDMLFAALLCIASVIFSAFGLWGGFRAGFTAASLIMFGIITAYLWSKTVKIKPFYLICAVIAIALSISFTITSNGSVRFWSFASIILLSLIWYYSLVSGDKENKLGLPASAFMPIFDGALPNLPYSVAAIFSGEGKGRKSFGKALLGIALAIPVLIVVIPLLISSDAAFSGFAEKISADVGMSVLKIAVGVIITPFVISYCFTLKKKEVKAPHKTSFAGIENTIVISFLSVLSICYLLYLFSQLAYFFSAFSGFLPQDYEFTVSAYARRGFFEMCVIAAINFIIIFIVLAVSRKAEGKICIASRALCTFIGFFTLIIIATAISKMILYIGSFGMTELRITTSAFMIFLAITFIALMTRIYIPRVPVLHIALVTAGIVLAVLGICNVNSVIAGYNYNAYKNKILNTVDVRTIYELGDEGIPYLALLAEDSDEETAEKARGYLCDAVVNDGYYEIAYNGGEYFIKEKNYSDIGQYSISRSKAYEVMDEYIKENPEILYETNQYEDDIFTDDFLW